MERAALRTRSCWLFAAALAPALSVAAPAENHWASAADPAHAEAYAAAARLIEAEAFAAALPVLERLAERMPANADVFNLLGFSHRRLDALDASAEAYARALYLAPDHLGALEYQGELFLRMGDVAAAEANLARLEAACDGPCEERDELAAAIADWRAAQAR